MTERWDPLDRLDAAGRLAQGRPAVEHTQRYVLACRALGYQHPDLTSHPAQIHDWYDGEDGLDLYALDADCARLRAAAATVEEALRVQRDQAGALAAAWTGPGADAAVDLLRRHCGAGGAVAAEVRAAAQRCEALRDNLWQLIDIKVETVIAIDDRSAVRRPLWLAAADAVTAGTGDRQAVEELVDREIKPYVDNDIRDEWLTAVRSATVCVGTCYDMVTDKMAAAGPVRFEIPGDLGAGRGRQHLRSPARTSAATVSPAPAGAHPLRDPTQSVSTQPVLAPTSPTGPTGWTGDPTGGGGLGDGLGGSGLGGGLADRIMDAIGGLLGPGDPPADEHPDQRDSADPEEDPEKEPDRDPGEDPHAPDDHAAPVEPAAEPVRPVVAPTPAADAPPPAGPPNMPGPPDPAETPCETAADALPQAGG